MHTHMPRAQSYKLRQLGVSHCQQKMLVLAPGTRPNSCLFRRPPVHCNLHSRKGRCCPSHLAASGLQGASTALYAQHNVGFAAMRRAAANPAEWAWTHVQMLAVAVRAAQCCWGALDTTLVAPEWEGAACGNQLLLPSHKHAGTLCRGPREHVCLKMLQQELRLQLQGCWGARDQNRRSKKTGLGPKTLSIYTLSTCCNYHGAHSSSRHTHTHTPKPNRSRCCIAKAAGTHTQLLARDAFPASVNRKQQLRGPRHRPARAAVQRRATKAQNPSYKHTISCSSTTVNTCSPSQSCQQRAQGDKLLRKDAAVGVLQREDSQPGTKTHWGCTMCDMGTTA